jgi:hypothetical protein
MKVHQQKEIYIDTEVFFQIVELQSSFQVWAGSGVACFGSMVLALPPTRVNDNQPLSTALLGSSDTVTSVAKRLG